MKEKGRHRYTCQPENSNNTTLILCECCKNHFTQMLSFQVMVKKKNEDFENNFVLTGQALHGSVPPSPYCPASHCTHGPTPGENDVVRSFVSICDKRAGVRRTQVMDTFRGTRASWRTGAGVHACCSRPGCRPSGAWLQPGIIIIEYTHVIELIVQGKRAHTHAKTHAPPRSVGVCVCACA
jgi:hypothetical protein